MAKEVISFNTRVAANINKYDLDSLFDTKHMHTLIKSMAELLDMEILVTNSDGSQIFCAGNFKDFNLDVDADPGRNIIVKNRIVGHLYIKSEQIATEKKAIVDKFIDEICRLFVTAGEQTFLYNEAFLYISELEDKVKSDAQKSETAKKIDPLTGVFNSMYFAKREEIFDRSETAPIAIIEVNINDWRYANDNFGDEGSDRLIKIVAGILREEAKPEYVIGRTDGDVFCVLIPIPEDGEAEEYVARIQQKCNEYEDEQLTPSIACGLVYKENVEEKISDKLSDAEYLMFENKLEIKASLEYQRRLHRNER